KYAACVKSAQGSSGLLSARATSPKHSNRNSVERRVVAGPVVGARDAAMVTRRTGENSTYGTANRPLSTTEAVTTSEPMNGSPWIVAPASGALAVYASPTVTGSRSTGIGCA